MRASRERKRPAWQNEFQVEQVAKEPKPKHVSPLTKKDEKLDKEQTVENQVENEASDNNSYIETIPDLNLDDDKEPEPASATPDNVAVDKVSQIFDNSLLLKKK